jgi:uncharacterized membrane protein
MFSEVADEVVTPPLYYVLSWGWIQAFGSGEVGLRSLSALLGTAAIPVVFAIGNKLGGARVGYFAAALAATSPLLVWYSQEARVYALFFLFGALSLLCFLEAREKLERRWLAGWAAFSALALATHYFALFLVGGELIWLLVLARRRGMLGEASIAAAVVVAVGIALLPLALHQRGDDGAGWIAAGLSGGLPLRIAAVPAEFITGRRAPHHTALAVLGLTLALLATLPLIRSGAARFRNAALVGVALAAAALVPAVILALAGLDYLITRNVILAWIPLAVIAALGAAATRARAVGTSLIAALCGFGVIIVAFVAFNVRHQRDDWRSAAEAVAAKPSAGPRALVATPGIGGAAPLLVYLPSSRRLGGELVAVEELDLLSLAIRKPGGPLHTPRPPSPPPPLPGFKLFERVEGSTFTLVRYRASRPLPVSRSILTRRTLTGRRGAVLLLP